MRRVIQYVKPIWINILWDANQEIENWSLRNVIMWCSEYLLDIYTRICQSIYRLHLNVTEIMLNPRDTIVKIGICPHGI